MGSKEYKMRKTKRREKGNDEDERQVILLSCLSLFFKDYDECIVRALQRPPHSELSC
jgi:hypothetical protein